MLSACYFTPSIFILPYAVMKIINLAAFSVAISVHGIEHSSAGSPVFPCAIQHPNCVYSANFHNTRGKLLSSNAHLLKIMKPRFRDFFSLRPIQMNSKTTSSFCIDDAANSAERVISYGKLCMRNVQEWKFTLPWKY